ncbi:MAG: hypothetical protein ACC656_00025 [Candidatus Heimdallarchaeota archaeon]
MKKLIEVKNEDQFVYGLYNVPESVTSKQFETEFNRFDEQDDFDEENLIGVERVFFEEYILNS